MKTEEDEAFEELAKRQGDWGMQGSRKHQILRYVQDQERNDVVPNTIAFHSMNTEWVMRITADRRIEVNKGVEVTEAARQVLNAMQGMLDVGLEKAVLAEQEPVAWMSPSWIDPNTRGWQSDSFESIPIEGWLPIYLHPSQRTEQKPAQRTEPLIGCVNHDCAKCKERNT